MTKFRVGDRVVINKKGFDLYGYTKGRAGGYGNPKCEGTITLIGEFHIYVDWDNGTNNLYSEDTLDLVPMSLENE